jgi:hypothetical protein
MCMAPNLNHTPELYQHPRLSCANWLKRGRPIQDTSTCNQQRNMYTSQDLRSLDTSSPVHATALGRLQATKLGVGRTGYTH